MQQRLKTMRALTLFTSFLAVAVGTPAFIDNHEFLDSQQRSNAVGLARVANTENGAGIVRIDNRESPQENNFLNYIQDDINTLSRRLDSTDDTVDGLEFTGRRTDGRLDSIERDIDAIKSKSSGAGKRNIFGIRIGNKINNNDNNDSPKDNPFIDSNIGSNIGSNPFIVGGDDTDIDDRPWQVAIFYWGRFLCGGSIISKRWIVTSAGCLIGKSAWYLDVVVGSDSISYGRYKSSDVIPVSMYRIHNRFDYWKNDLGLIKLRYALNLNDDETKKIALADDNEDFEGDACVISGYGQTSENRYSLPDELQSASVDVVSNSDCSRTFRNNRRISWSVVVSREQMCAGEKAGGTGICSGDEGGPLACKRSDNSWVLAGVASTSFGCARENTYGLFTRVSEFSDDIKSTLKYYGE